MAIGVGGGSVVEPMGSRHAREVATGQRFEFGSNWKRFLSALDEDRIVTAERTLQRMLEMDRLDGKRFLDVGSGSGLSSLAAVRLGAQVHSFDYDPQSVACTRWLKERYAPQAEWVVEEGSVLARSYLDRLGQFDVVYAWGVLHHTGAMWQALENVAPLVRGGGKFYLAIYNDRGGVSRRWRAVKRFYNKSPRWLRPLIVLPFFLYHEGLQALKDLLRGRDPLRAWRQYANSRGMHKWYDWIDWIGGYPYEVAKPEEIFEFYKNKGFALTKLLTHGGNLGCNEYVFINGRVAGSQEARAMAGTGSEMVLR